MATSFTSFAGDKLGLDRDVLIAATPDEMRSMLDKLTHSALAGNMPAETFGSGLVYLDSAAKDPNFIGENIRNTMSNPLARTLVSNPDLAEQMAKSSVGMLGNFGINVDDAKGYIGPGMDLLKQAKKDGILKSDVTDNVVAEKLQKPLYTAVQGYVKDNKDNPRINKLIYKSNPHLQLPEGISALEGYLSGY